MEDQEVTEEVEAPQGEVVESQDTKPEIDWKSEARKWETRAKEQKAAADRWREYEASTKTIEERRAEELEEVKRELDLERTSRLRLEIAADRGIGGEAIKLLDGSTREEIEEKADAILSLLADQSKPKSIKPDDLQGRAATAVSSIQDQFAQAIDDIL